MARSAITLRETAGWGGFATVVATGGVWLHGSGIVAGLLVAGLGGGAVAVLSAVIHLTSPDRRTGIGSRGVRDA